MNNHNTQLEIHPILGKVHWHFGNNKGICESGVYDKNKFISYVCISHILVEAKGFSAYGSDVLEVFRFWVCGENKTNIHFDVYTSTKTRESDLKPILGGQEFIVSQIFERQWSKMMADIESGLHVVFGNFSFSKSCISIKSFFGSFKLSLSQVIGWHIQKGQIVVIYYDKNMELKQKSMGFINEIPNIHLAQSFLQSLADTNKKLIRDLKNSKQII